MIRLHVPFTLVALVLLCLTATQAKSQKAPAARSPLFHAARPLPAEDKKHLLNDTFTVVKTVREMPDLVREKLISNSSDPLNGMADAGQAFEVGCVVSGKLPSRQLVLAAINAHYCLVYFEHGGVFRGQQIRLFSLQNGHAALLWNAGLFCQPPLTFLEIQTALKTKEIAPMAPGSTRRPTTRHRPAPRR